jgi:hypothetical protein
MYVCEEWEEGRGIKNASHRRAAHLAMMLIAE